MKQQTGWLGPDGNFYPCKHYEHVSKAEEICGVFLYPISHTHYDDELLKLGWAKLGVSLLGNKHFYIRWEKRLTDFQKYELKSLFDNQKQGLPLDALTLTMWKYEDDYFKENDNNENME